VGVTRRSRLGAQYPKYAGRLNAERGLSRKAVVRAATFNAAYQLHQDRLTGSLERGKLADLIVLDRNLFRIPAGRIAGTRVLLTMVGGQVVYRSRRLR
jgi:predicted amidohydrolase YtcJ